MKIKTITFFMAMIFFCLAGCTLFKKYEVTDGAQYENVRKTVYYKKVDKYSSLVMPDSIDPYWNVQEYLFSFDPWDESYEEFLEIIIEDNTQYQEYCTSLFNGEALTRCAFDLDYQEYVVSDKITTTTNNQGEQCLLTAEVQKIIINDTIQSIIFVSISIPSNYGPISFSRFKYFARFDVFSAEN
ncbi:MAG: hypothetical protein IKD47_01820 [Clostridia bacterium]|nr:hypothetical protein [Clostridia bacterium]